MPTRRLRSLVVALAAWPWVVGAQPTQPLGTLLYSAEERAAIVRQRTAPAEPESQQAPTVFKVTGVLVRQGGKGTAWVNGQPVLEGPSSLAGIPVAIQRGQVSIHNQTIRPGETLDFSNRQRIDSVPAGLTVSQSGRQPVR